MKRWTRILMVLPFAIWGVLRGAELPSLRLVGSVPLAQVKNREGLPLKLHDLETPMGGEIAYGFVQGGKAVFFGRGKRIMDVKTGKLEDAIPGEIKAEFISADGFDVYGRKLQDSTVRVKWDTRTGSLSECWYGLALHPDGETWGSGFDERYEGYRNITLRKGVCERSAEVVLSAKQDTYITALSGFTASGNYWIALDRNKPRLIDTRTMKLLPPDPEMVSQKASGENYIGDSEVFVFNRDASWVAGFSSEFDPNDEQIALFIWNLKAKQFVWKGKALGGPEIFSPNDKYLLTRAGYILIAATGEIAFQGLKGKTGKFSPDGRSLVTVDDEAFYVYTLPKESEPIFGVFQKPEPWSPPGEVKRSGKSPGKKPLKKP